MVGAAACAMIFAVKNRNTKTRLEKTKARPPSGSLTYFCYYSTELPNLQQKKGL
jgi:hypothetical protein